MTTDNPNVNGRGWLSQVIHLANNWISLAGVVIVTTATIFCFQSRWAEKPRTLTWEFSRS